jgi:beta-lactamase family protein
LDLDAPVTRSLSAGFSCLARVIEVIERKPFGAVLRDRIFQPASMARASEETGQRLMPNRALPYRLGEIDGRVALASASYKDLTFLTGTGSVYATAEDLLHLVRALRRGAFGNAGQRRLADSAGITGRGWYGRTDGYEASVDYAPNRNLTFVFLSNPQSAANWQLRQQIGKLLLGGNATAILRPPAVASTFEAPESLVGSYGDRSNAIAITVVDGHLFRDDNEFYPTAEGSYYIPASGSRMRFRRAADGRVDALITARADGSETVSPRLVPAPN